MKIVLGIASLVTVLCLAFGLSEADQFRRLAFGGVGSVRGMVIMPRHSAWEVVTVIVMGSGMDSATLGREMRKLTESGICAAAFDGLRAGETDAPEQLHQALRTLRAEPWARSRLIVLLGVGAGRTLVEEYARQFSLAECGLIAVLPDGAASDPLVTELRPDWVREKRIAAVKQGAAEILKVCRKSAVPLRAETGMPLLAWLLPSALWLGIFAWWRGKRDWCLTALAGCVLGGSGTVVFALPFSEFAAGDGEAIRHRMAGRLVLPKVKHLSDASEKAQLTALILQQLVVIGGDPKTTADGDRGMTTFDSFPLLYAQTLRAVGVTARLTSEGEVRIFTGHTWICAPQVGLPSVVVIAVSR